MPHPDTTANRKPVPRDTRPMRGVGGTLPFDDEGWAYEIKWDGMRALAGVEQGRLRLHNGNLVEVTMRYPELAPLADAFDGHQVLLDGEIVVTDESGEPRFERLQARMHLTQAAVIRERRAQFPARYMIFDLLHLDGIDLAPLPYLDRRRFLEEIVPPGPSWQVPGYHLGDGRQMLEQARSHRLEGLVAKRIDSRYEPGRRSPSWIKIKVRRHQELVVGGWLPGTGVREQTFGALLMGYYDNGRLRYAGRVGTGFTDSELKRLLARFADIPADACPFDPPPPRPVVRLARWLQPILVAEVAFGEWTPDGILRHPGYLGLRDDKDPKDVVREPVV